MDTSKPSDRQLTFGTGVVSLAAIPLILLSILWVAGDPIGPHKGQLIAGGYMLLGLAPLALITGLVCLLSKCPGIKLGLGALDMTAGLGLIIVGLVGAGLITVIWGALAMAIGIVLVK